jgi:predicted dehydrogenase
LAALNAGKPVYVEKPMTLNAVSAKKIADAAKKTNQKIVVAHYRRAQPLFKKIKEIIDHKIIGEPLFATLQIFKKGYTKEDLDIPQKAWRVDPTLSGGGLFHDLAPHQLDMMYHFFGEPEFASGLSGSQGKIYTADDVVMGSIRFKSGVLFNGVWALHVNVSQEKDHCEIMGTKGSIRFSFFEHRPVSLTIDNMTEEIPFDPIPHVQQPMIEKVVSYFLDQGPNPCSAEEGVEVMKLIDAFTQPRM